MTEGQRESTAWHVLSYLDERYSEYVLMQRKVKYPFVNVLQWKLAHLLHTHPLLHLPSYVVVFT